MGHDGSGKTTMAQELIKFFNTLGFKAIYKHEYEYFILKYLLKIIDKRIQKEREKMIIERDKSFKFYIWPILVWIDFIIEYLYFKLFKRRDIIICDRYIYDHYISFKYLGYLTKISEWLYLHSPRPDIGIILWVNPLIAYKRKIYEREVYSLSFYKEVVRMYMQLGKRLGVPMLNTSISLHSTKMRLLEILFTNDKLRKQFITHCRINKVLYWALTSFELNQLNMFEELYKYYKEKYIIFDEIINFLKTLNVKYILKDIRRDFPWVPEFDIDIIVGSSQDIDTLKNKLFSNKNIDVWNRFFRFDVIPYEKIKEFIVLGCLNYSSVKNLNSMPVEYLLVTILINGFIRLDEYLLLKKYNKKIKVRDKGLKILEEYVSTILFNRHIHFPHFIPLGVFIKSLLASKLLIWTKIRILAFSIIIRIWYKISGKLLYHPLMRISEAC